MSEIKSALEALGNAKGEVGLHWKRAHEIAQAHEGEAVFDRIHALCHRIEGDTFNANYWYRSADVEPFQGSFEEELAALKAELS